MVDHSGGRWDDAVERRRFLRAVAGCSAAALAGCTSADNFVEESSIELAKSRVSATIDHREFLSGHESVHVPSGGTVRWEWDEEWREIVPESTPAGSDWTGARDGPNETYGENSVYEYTFDVPGTYEYRMVDSYDRGSRGVVEVLPVPASSTTVVTVGPGGSLVFQPEKARVTVGDTVYWVWASDNHNIYRGDNRRAWNGTPGGEDATYDEGYVYERTFEEPGTYYYYCSSHVGVDMSGTVEVYPDR